IRLVQRRLGNAYDYMGASHIRSLFPSCQGMRIAQFRHRASGIEMHLIPGGNLPGAPTQLADGSPMPRVAPIIIGRFPVRQQEWDRFGGLEDRRWRWYHLPMEGVSFNDIQA